MRILVTNDDGVESPGSRRSPGCWSRPATTCSSSPPPATAAGAAPPSAPSGARARSRSSPTTGRQFLTPRCARSTPRPPPRCSPPVSALRRPPDLVASGINPGANTGHLVLHSGTVGATLTGRATAFPASRSRWSGARRHATTGTPRPRWRPPRSSGRPSPTAARVLNINVPNRASDELLGVREAGAGAVRDLLGRLGRRVRRRPEIEIKGRRPRARHRCRLSSPGMCPSPR